jgi:DNA-binding IclR family transcriptional regulator
MSQSLSRALDLLNALQGESRSLGELAELLGVHKSTVLRLLQTLEADRFVTHDSAHRYSLGSKLFDLAGSALAQRDVRTVARKHLETLNARTGQTVHLATYESGEVVYIDKLDAVQGFRMYSRVGLRAALYCTGVAKVLVASMPLDVRTRLANGIDYVPLTPRTISGPAEYLAELQKVSDQGYAEDHGEHESFINCVAVGVRDATGATIAAVSVSVPDVVLPYADVIALLPTVRQSAELISADLGYRAP